jgi:hypothetical protein
MTLTYSDKELPPKISIKTMVYVLGVVAGAIAVIIGLVAHREIRELRQSTQDEIASLKAQQMMLVRNVGELNGRAEAAEKRLLGRIEVESSFSSQSMQSINLMISLIPKIGQRVALTGEVRNSKMGWYLSMPAGDAAYFTVVHLKETSSPSYGNNMLIRYKFKKVSILGVLRFGPIRSPVDEADYFYFDPEECQFNELTGDKIDVPVPLPAIPMALPLGS